jgi:hypothetical protein
MKIMAFLPTPEGGSREKLQNWALAVRTFIDLRKYVQNIVIESLTPNSPPASGTPEVYFPTVEGFSQTASGGQEQIAHDPRYLIASGIRLHTTEHFCD